MNEILSVAGANGITKYRWYNSGGPSFPANTFGQTMTTQLDGFRINMRRLAAINAQAGNVCGVAHTHSGNLGTSVYDILYAMQGIDPAQIGINLAIGHTADAAPGVTWQLEMRRAMPYIKGTALQDLKGTINATTGALSYFHRSKHRRDRRRRRHNQLGHVLLAAAAGWLQRPGRGADRIQHHGRKRHVGQSQQRFLRGQRAIHQRQSDAGDHGSHHEDRVRLLPAARPRRRLDCGADNLSLNAAWRATVRHASTSGRALFRRAPFSFGLTVMVNSSDATCARKPARA